jgi:hypothetical protein
MTEDVSLREFLLAQIDAVEKRSDQRFEAMKAQVDAAFEASQRAIDKADISTEKRFEGVNEFRSALSDQSAHFVTNETLAVLGDKLQAGIDRNRDDLDVLAKRIDVRQGELEGAKVTKGALYSGIAAAVAIIGLLVVLANYLTNN